MKFEPRTAVVTSGTHGVCRAHVQRLAELSKGR